MSRQPDIDDEEIHKNCEIITCARIFLAGNAFLATRAVADDQTKPGAGNAAAIALAKKSPIVLISSC